MINGDDLNITYEIEIKPEELDEMIASVVFDGDSYDEESEEYVQVDGKYYYDEQSKNPKLIGEIFISRGLSRLEDSADGEFTLNELQIKEIFNEFLGKIKPGYELVRIVRENCDTDYDNNITLFVLEIKTIKKTKEKEKAEEETQKDVKELSFTTKHYPIDC